MNCCRDVSWKIHELPFGYNVSYHIILDYYDGPLVGFTSCEACGQGYYYKLLAWDEKTLDCRVFNFHQIDFTGKQLAESLGIKGDLRKNGGIAPPGSMARFSFTPPAPTHICVSDTHFRTGLWRKRVPADNDVTDWVKFLGLTPPND